MVKELIEKRARLAAEATAVLGEKRALTADESAKVDAIHADIEKITKEIEQREKQEKLEKHLAASQPRRTDAGSPVVDVRQAARDRDLILRGWLLAGSQDPTPEMVEAASRAKFNLRSRMITFNLASNPREYLRSFETRAGEAQQVGVSADGGYTVADEVMRPLEDALLHFGGMRQVANTVRTNTGATLPFPTANDTDELGEIVAERGSVGAHDGIVFGIMNLGAFKYSSRRILVTTEFLQDSSINVAEYVGRKCGERIGRKQNSDFTIGGGTTLPWGIVTRSAVGLAPAGSVAAGITYDNLVDLEHSVDVAYRQPNGKWLMHDLMLARLKKLKDGNGLPLWSPGLVASAPNTILGYPYQVNNDMTSAATNGSKALLFGDLSKYTVRDVKEVTLLRLDELEALSGQVVFVAFSRADGDLLDAGVSPVKHFAYTT